MFPIDDTRKRFEEVLREIDACAEDVHLPEASAELFEDTNAELEDALFMMSTIRAEDDDWREALEETLEELEALEGAYRSLIPLAPALEAPVDRLGKLLKRAADDLDR